MVINSILWGPTDAPSIGRVKPDCDFSGYDCYMKPSTLSSLRMLDPFLATFVAKNELLRPSFVVFVALVHFL